MTLLIISTISLHPSSFKGYFRKGEEYYLYIMMENPGKDTVVIKNINSSCSCLRIKNITRKIPPKSKTIITLRFYFYSVFRDTVVKYLFIKIEKKIFTFKMVAINTTSYPIFAMIYRDKLFIKNRTSKNLDVVLEGFPPILEKKRFELQGKEIEVIKINKKESNDYKNFSLIFCVNDKNYCINPIVKRNSSVLNAGCKLKNAK